LASQQYMQDWAAGNHGLYTMATTVGDLEMGHDRVNCLLSSPKRFSIEPASSHVTRWTDASPWAKDELERAAELGLIPDSLHEVDLREDITRREFAAVAV